MPALNERFGAMAALPRVQFCGNLDVITPQQVQWKPPLRQAAGPLCASGGQCGGQIREDLNVANNSKFREYLQFNKGGFQFKKKLYLCNLML
jgi:hypothetical protein